MRFALVGNSGSGKTTLARKLAERGQVALLDLDTVAWEPGKIAVARPTELARADVRKFCSTHRDWVVEGCYAGLIDATFPFQPVLVFLDPGLGRCVEHCRSCHAGPKHRLTEVPDTATIDAELRPGH
jgi:adenylate kinase family enzyme